MDFSTLAKKYSNPGLDWALISLTEVQGIDFGNILRIDGTTISTSKISDLNPYGTVRVISRAANYRRSYCSGTMALISLPGSNEVRRVYSISSLSHALERGRRHVPHDPARRGESGSLVVDEVSGDAHGLVVAISDDLALSYVVPIRDIFEDISQRWNGAPVTFPSILAPLLAAPREVQYKEWDLRPDSTRSRDLFNKKAGKTWRRETRNAVARNLDDGMPLDAGDPAHFHSPRRKSSGSEDEDLLAGEYRASYSFEPENANELRLYEGQHILVLHHHGQGWLVAEDKEAGEQGLVPEAYVRRASDIPNDEELMEDVG